VNTNERYLASELLKKASEEASRAGCNDWRFPGHWTEQERHDFVRRYHEWNGDPEEYDRAAPARLPDFAVMGFLAWMLIQEETFPSGERA